MAPSPALRRQRYFQRRLPARRDRQIEAARKEQELKRNIRVLREAKRVRQGQQPVRQQPETTAKIEEEANAGPARRGGHQPL